MGTLFEEMCIGSLRARNRLVRAATYEGLATDDGHLTPELAAVCEDLAAGGAGTVILGYAYVTPDEQPNPRMLGIYDDSFVPEYRELVERLHSYGARVVSQIVYGGSATKLDPPSARILGPSAVPNPKTGIVPVEASRGDIRLLVESFAAAARRARDAGFDGVELHAAHGYLLSQFLNPLLNRRTDEYGGPVENRARIVVEALAAIRREAGAEYPVLVKLNSSDGVEGGLTEDDSLEAAQLLVEAGVSAIEVSGPWRACRARFRRRAVLRRLRAAAGAGRAGAGDPHGRQPPRRRDGALGRRGYCRVRPVPSPHLRARPAEPLGGRPAGGFALCLMQRLQRHAGPPVRAALAGCARSGRAPQSVLAGIEASVQPLFVDKSVRFDGGRVAAACRLRAFAIIKPYDT